MISLKDSQKSMQCPNNTYQIPNIFQYILISLYTQKNFRSFKGFFFVVTLQSKILTEFLFM